MAGLHTWCGLTCGWLLCAIFLAGSLSVFRAPITRWMQAAPVLPVLSSTATSAGSSHAALAAVLAHLDHLDHLDRHAASAKAWSLVLPQAPGDALLLSWRDADGRTMQRAADPADGRLLPSPWGRQTEGGRHFMLLHYMLHAGNAGFWLVGWIAMCALVALVSGIVVHKRIFKDFFTFRPGKGQRSWLDAHNACAVLTLPFLLMIVYTGLTYFYSSYLPLPLRAVYGSGADAYPAFSAELKHGTTATKVALPASVDVLPALGALQDRAEALIGSPVRRIFILRPGRPDMVVRMQGDSHDSADDHRNHRAIHVEAGLMVFEQASASIVEVIPAGAPEHFASAHVHPVLEQLHVAGFGGWGIKWLYFLSGLAGTAMIATGLLLFALKRRQKSQHEFGRMTAPVYRAIDILNIAAISGAGIASIGFFYANRLIPAQLAERAGLEIRAYFFIWLACLLHAAIRPRVRAWREQTLALALLCLGLPLLNRASTGQHLLAYLQAHDWQRAGVESAVLVIGATALLAWRRLPQASSR